MNCETTVDSACHMLNILLLEVHFCFLCYNNSMNFFDSGKC